MTSNAAPGSGGREFRVEPDLRRGYLEVVLVRPCAAASGMWHA